MGLTYSPLAKKKQMQRTSVVPGKARVCQEMPKHLGSKCYFNKVFALSEDDVQPCGCSSNQWELMHGASQHHLQGEPVFSHEPQIRCYSDSRSLGK